MVEGAVVEGAVVEGPVVEGPVVEGPVVEGPVVEGPVVEGPVVAALRPRAVPSASPDDETVTATSFAVRGCRAAYRR
jgi:hypothetical protein